MNATRFPQPTSVDGIKRLAKRLKVQDQIPHSKALDVAARQAGFSNFTDAKRRLDKVAQACGRASSREMSKGQPMPLEDFHQRAQSAWDNAIESIAGTNQASTIVWHSPDRIAAALEPFMGQNNNHAHLPTGGGQDFTSVRSSVEPGCLEFRYGGRTGYIVKPKSLTLERIDVPGNSFLLLELDELKPSGVYHLDPEEGDEAEENNRRRLASGSEELLELSPGEYENRDLWDRDFLGHDPEGNEIPFPDEARVIVRFFRGSILFVAKGSYWNGDPRTYSGEHDRLSSVQIRKIIENWAMQDA